MKIIETDFYKWTGEPNFKEGLRALFLIDRAVGNTNKGSSRWVKKIIVQDQASYCQAFDKLKELITSPTHRIYAHLNQRKIIGSIREFKRKQLDADYSANPLDFYKDALNQFVSAMSIPANRADGYFLIDLDRGDDSQADESIEYMKKVSELNDRAECKNFKLYRKYKTKNGWHYITSPFNPHFPVLQHCEVKKDALALLAYCKE